jgi:hypothetical protein
LELASRFGHAWLQVHSPQLGVKNVDIPFGSGVDLRESIKDLAEAGLQAVTAEG